MQEASDETVVNVNGPIGQRHGDNVLFAVKLCAWAAFIAGGICAVAGFGEESVALVAAGISGGIFGVLMLAMEAVGRAIIAGALALQRMEMTLDPRGNK